MECYCHVGLRKESAKTLQPLLPEFSASRVLNSALLEVLSQQVHNKTQQQSRGCIGNQINGQQETDLLVADPSGAFQQ